MLVTVTAPPELRAGPGPGDAGTAAAVIRTDALTKRYPGNVTALAGCSVIVAVGGEINRGAFLPLAFVLFTVAATCRRSVAVTGLIASLALLVVQALILIIAWMVGITAQQRRSYTARVREQVAATAVTEERLRIARELHDVVQIPGEP